MSPVATLAPGEDGALRIGNTGIAEIDRLVASLSVSELIIDDALFSTPGEDGLQIISGRTRFGRNDRAWQASLVWRTGAGQVPSAELHLLANDPDTIGGYFGTDMPGSIVSNDTGYLDTLPTSIIATLAIENVAVVTDGTTNSFTADLAVDQSRDSGSLAPYTPFPISPAVTLQGTWKGSATPINFTLYGASTSGIPLPGFITDFGLRLSNEFDLFGGTAGDKVSAASFYLRTNETLGGAALVVPLLYNDSAWTGSIVFVEPVSLARGLEDLAELIGLEDTGLITLPPGLDLFASFALTGLQMSFDPGGSGEAPSLKWIGASISSPVTWHPPIPKINAISAVGANFRYDRASGEQPGMMMASIFGALTLGDPSKTQLTLDCSLQLPTFDIAIVQKDDESVDFGDFLANIMPVAVLPSDWKLNLSGFRALATMQEREFSAAMDLKGDCPTGIPHIALDELAATIDVGQNGASGSVLAVLSVGEGDGALIFQVGADYSSGDGWEFAGGLQPGPPLDVAAFVQSITQEEPPKWLVDMGIQVGTLWFTYSTGEGKPYSAAGSIHGKLPLKDVFTVDIAIDAAAHVKRDADGTMHKGLSGTFVIGDVTIICSIEFDDPKVWEFQVVWDGVTFDAVTVPIKDDSGEGTHNAVRITLAGVTLGDIVTRFIHMIDPNLDMTLDAPWNVLNDVDLSRARLTIDPKHSRLTVELETSIDLGFMDITMVGLIYDRGSPKGSVRYELQGDFLGVPFGQDNPLTWDAINDAPPAVPAAGPKTLEIHYMGLGQHVGLRTPPPQTIPDTLQDMREIILPADGQANPIPVGHYDADMGWLAGLDMTLMGFIGLKMVFADPVIYGLHVGLSGDGAKALAGLAIDLTYRKVSSDVGVFHVQLALPDAYRQIELGAVSVTLGIIGVDVYTDGGFEIDLGFPRGGDYSRAFTVEAGPFLGRGGIYFGVLQSGGSSRIPLATNGGFGPVIEAGVGFAGGVGRDFNKGPLSAGVYVQLEAIFEGALGWFHPTDASQPTEMYYYCRATAGIAGKLYGSVDFGIISASVSLEAQATATVVLEAYKATLVDLDVEVSVSASVHLLFVHISFSFDMELQVSFMIGDDSDAPWILQSGTGGDATQRIDLIYARNRRTARHGVEALRQLYLKRAPKMLGNAPPLTLDWHGGDVQVFSKHKIVDMTIAASLTIDGPAVQWDATPPPAPAAVPLMTFMPVTLSAGTGTDAEDPINILIEAMLRWALDAAGQLSEPDVDIGVLAQLDQQMRSQDTLGQFSWTSLSEFFSQNVFFNFHDFSSALVGSGTALPMVPAFGRTDGGANDPSIDYWTFTPIAAGYEAALDAWVASLSVAPPAGAAGTGSRLIAAGDSFPRMMFRSYFLMMAKAIVSEAVTVAGTWQQAIPPSASLADVARTFTPVTRNYVKTAGDTIDAAAASYGVSVDELVFLNPAIVAQFNAASVGDVLPMKIGVTPQSIAAGNLGLALAEGKDMKRVDLAPLPWQVSVGDTLAGITSGTVADWLAVMSGPSAIADDLTVLQAGAALPLQGTPPAATPHFVWAGGAPLGDAQRAAILYVRLTDISAQGSNVQGKLSAWCSTLIASLNPTLRWTSAGLPIDPPATIIVPIDDKGGSGPWTMLPGDTLSRLARAVALVIDPTAFVDPTSAQAFATFATALTAANKPNQPVVLPAGTGTRILDNESLSALAARLLTDVGDAGFADIVGAASILAPGRTLIAPMSLRPITAEPPMTIQQVANAYGLSAEAVGGRLADVAGLWGSEATVAIAHAAALPTEALIAQTMAKGANAVRGQLTRFMLQGLRIPAPNADGSGFGTTLAPIAALTGQEAPLATFAVTGDPKYAYRAQFGFTEAGQSWVTFASTPDFMTTGLTSDDVANHMPATILAPIFVPDTPPASAAALSVPAAMRWDLSQRILWTVPSWPSNLLGQGEGGAVPGLWPLPDALLIANSAHPEDNPLTLQQIDPQAPPGTQPSPVANWCLGTRIDVSIRLTGTPEIYELLAVASDQRDLLLDLWQNGTNLDIALLYQPPGSSSAPACLASPALSATVTTVLVQTNLSTESKDDSLAATPAPPAPAAAPITDANNFLQLVWECSMVGGGGYWLRIATADNQGLPAGIFDQNGRATLTLLAAAPAPVGNNDAQTLQIYHNSAVIGDPIAPATSHVFFANTLPIFNRALPLMAPGKSAFEMSMLEPIGAPTRAGDGTVTNDPSLQTRQLFQLLGYRVAESPYFNASDIGLPIAPTSITCNGKPGWYYSATLPIHRFAAKPTSPAVTGLPDPAADPYAAIVLDTTVAPPVAATAPVELWFQDINGNPTEGAPTDVLASLAFGVPPASNLYTVQLPSLYTDPVPAIDQWPSAASNFVVSGMAAAPRIDVRIELQLSAYSPAPAQLASALAKTIASHRDHYATIWYQLHRPDFTATLASSLQQPDAKHNPAAPLTIDLPPLRHFAAGAYAYLAASYAAATPASGDYHPVATCTTIGAVTATYGVDYSDLAAVNGGVTIEALSHACQIPVFVQASQGKSMIDLCGNQTAAAATLALSNNADLPMTAGLEIAVPPRNEVVPSGLGAADLSLTALAARYSCSPVGLATASATLPCLAPNVPLALPGVVPIVTTSATIDNLAAVVTQFVSLGAPIDLTGLARAIADVHGLVTDGATLSIASYVVAPGDTLGKNNSGSDQAALAPINTTVDSLFPAGTPIYLNSVTPTAADLTRPLSEVASTYGLSVEQLFGFWSATPPVDTTQLVLPGRLTIPPAPAVIRLPYTIQAGDTLNGIAPWFVGATALLLVTANWDMPSTLVAGQTVTVDTAKAVTRTGDSFAMLAARLGSKVDEAALAAAIADQKGLLNPGVLMLCPPATTTVVNDLTTLATRYGLDPKALGMANAGLAGWLVPATVFKLGDVTVPADGKPGDLSAYSLAGVVSAFAQQGVSTSVAALLDAYLTQPIIAEGAQFMLPPKPIDIILPIDLGATYPAQIFPITTTISFARDAALVEPGLLVNSTAAQLAVSQIAPRATPPAGTVGATPPTLNFIDFATSLETALPQLRVCAGKVDPLAAGRTHLYAVAFGDGGLAKTEVSTPASFFALRPLYPQPVSRSAVAIRRYGSTDPAVPTEIRNADVETWARGFLADVGTFLEPDYALMIYDLPSSPLPAVLTTKAQLASAIAAGVENLFDDSASPARTAARNKLEQQLLGSLGSAWAMSVMLQYDVTTAAAPGQTNVRLPIIPQLTTPGKGLAPGESHASIAGDAIDFASTSGFLSLATTVTPGPNSWIDLDLGAAVKEIEFAIEAIGATGYEESNWLAFIRPPVANPPPGWSIDLGTPRAPVPARSFPVAPLPIAQSARDDLAGPAGWAGAPYWRYEMSFSYAAAPQDQIVFGAIFNQAKPNVPQTPVDATLFEKLADYQANRGAIWDDLASGEATKVAQAATAFATAAQGIADAWTAHWADGARRERLDRLFRVGQVAAGSAPEAIGIAFKGTLVHAGDTYECLIVEPAIDGPVVTWPDIDIIIDGANYPLVPLDSSATRRRYAFPATPAVPVGATITYAPSIGGLHIATYQEAIGAIAVLRNGALLGVDAKPSILEDFIYRPSPIVFPVSVAPYLTFDAPFDGGDWEANGQAYLTAILAGLLTDGAASLTTVSVEARAGSAAISPALPLRLPIFYNPDATYPTTLAADITQRIATWATTWNPPSGWWEVAITAFSTLTDRPDEPLMAVRLAFARTEPKQ